MSAQACVPCGEEREYTAEEVEEEYLKLKGWDLVTNDGIKKLKRSFVCKNWLSAISFINKASEVAEACQHHPDIALTSYRNIDLLIYTHTNSTITKRDFELAHRLSAVDVEYSPKWARENPDVVLNHE
jgi:4a-hydroxytetrahydrobiopterin dehydratase